MASVKSEPLVADEESGEEEGSGQLLEWAGFVLRAAGRHRRLFFGVLCAMIVLVLAATALIPRVYEVNEKILAQRPLVLTSLVNPNRPISGEADIPTRGVQDMILRRDSLVAIIKETNLLDLWDVQRPAILRLKDKLTRFGAKPSDEDRLSALVGLLQQKLQVQVDEQSIKVIVQWDHPQTAFDIVNVAVKNFFEDRSASELAVLGETIGILDDELKKQSEEVEAALIDLRKLRAKQLEASGGAPAPAPTNDTSTASPTPAPKPEPEVAAQPSTSSVAAKLAEKRKQIKDLEEPRQKKLSELYAQLADLKSKFADANPSVIAKEQQIKEASVEPPELTQLKAEERALLEGSGYDDMPPEFQVAATPTKTTSAPKAAPKSKPKPAAAAATTGTNNPKEEDPDLTQARNRLNAATIKYQELSDRIESARMEVLSAQAAFKYRYTVVQPAELPKKPLKPNVPVLLVAGLMFALLSAIGAAAAKDVLSGRVIEAWQVKRRLKLPVLAQVRLGGR